MSSERGFTLIELLVVVAIIGIISAIAIPNLLNSLNRGRQKRTMADIRSMGEAIEVYSVDHQFYPKGVTGVTELAHYLSPTYMRELPAQDGWRSALVVVSDNTGSNYTIVSYGQDGTPDVGASSAGPTSDFDDDIVFRNGSFYRWPEGVQEN